MTVAEALRRSIEDARAMRREMIQQVTEMAEHKYMIVHSQDDRDHRAKFNALQDSIEEISASIFDMQQDLIEIMSAGDSHAI